MKENKNPFLKQENQESEILQILKEAKRLIKESREMSDKRIWNILAKDREGWIANTTIETDSKKQGMAVEYVNQTIGDDEQLYDYPFMDDYYRSINKFWHAGVDNRYLPFEPSPEAKELKEKLEQMQFILWKKYEEQKKEGNIIKPSEIKVRMTTNLKSSVVGNYYTGNSETAYHDEYVMTWYVDDESKKFQSREVKLGYMTVRNKDKASELLEGKDIPDLIQRGLAKKQQEYEQFLARPEIKGILEVEREIEEELETFWSEEKRIVIKCFAPGTKENKILTKALEDATEGPDTEIRKVQGRKVVRFTGDVDFFKKKTTQKNQDEQQAPVTLADLSKKFGRKNKKR